MIERISRIRPLWPRIEAESPAEKGKRRKSPANFFPGSKRHPKDKSDDDKDQGTPARVDVRV